MKKLEKKVKALGLTMNQLDNACRVRFVQDYMREMCVTPPEHWTWDAALNNKEKDGDRADMIEIIEIMRR